MAVHNLLTRRSRQRDNELFEDCSDDDLMSWGRELSDGKEPIFADRLPRPQAAIDEAGPRLALPLPDSYAG